MVDSQGQYGGSWFCSYYSQLSRKRPPLVQDKVVAYLRCSLTEKLNKISPMLDWLINYKKTFTSSAKTRQIEMKLFDFVFSHATVFGKSAIERCNCQCVSCQLKSLDQNVNQTKLTKPTSSLTVITSVISMVSITKKTEVLPLRCKYFLTIIQCMLSCWVFAYWN